MNLKRATAMLKPCPRCGGQGWVGDSHDVHCDDCGFILPPRDAVWKSVKDWNSFPIEAKQMMTYGGLRREYGHVMTIGEKFRFVFDMAQRARSAQGDIAEVGVYQGGVIAALAALFPDRTAHAFDTFQGMPATEFLDKETFHRPGDFSDTSPERVQSVFKTTNFMLHVGRFPETAIEGTFAFVHVDGDYYETTRDAIAWFWPRLSPGGIMVFDDYRLWSCPGVERALLEGSKQLDYEIHARAPGTVNDQAYIQKTS